MIRSEDGDRFLELADEIRMNRLVRCEIDVTGFVDWYEALVPMEQAALLYYLHLYAHQAGGREDIFEAAVAAAQVPRSHPLIRTLSLFRWGYVRDENVPERGLREEDWLRNQSDADRRFMLPVLVYLFGLAEGRVYARETVTSCNHWWHRDLLNERVVQDLLSNPRYAYTSMKDDVVLQSIHGETNNE